jgi:phage terminase large subunit-like protein
VNDLDRYATEVVRGSIPAGRYHRLACERHLRDRDREDTARFPYVFRLELAERFFRFAQNLRHYKGEWAGLPIHLEDHQKFRLGSLWAWQHRATGLRRFRAAYNEIPRKNGKSLEASTVALYGTFFDGEPGAEGYCVATKRDQSKIVFDDCKRLVVNSQLRSRIAVLTANLHRDDTVSKLEPLGSDKDSTDGLNPQIVIIDEAHAMKHRGMIDVMETATGARRQPLIFWITTAGNDPISPCGDQHHYACQVLDQVLDDESLFVFIAHADLDDDPWVESTWRKANPNYDVSVKPTDLQLLAAKAKAMPPAAATFKQKRLNLWVNADAPWLSLEGWRAGQSTWDAEELLGEECFVGIDLSSKIDLTAIAALFPPTETRPTWRLLHWGLTPAETLEERAHRDRAPYQVWVDQGWLLTNPGNQIDQDEVRRIVNEVIAPRFVIVQIGIDPWNAGNLRKHMENDGYSVLEIPQNLPQMSATCKDFEADVLDALVDANHNPLLEWSMRNATVVTDNKDNYYPTKKPGRSHGRRIDPTIATLLARKVYNVNLGVPADDPDLVVG